MSRYNPRNRNMPTHEAPKSTARWFDDRKMRPKHYCGFLMTDDGPVDALGSAMTRGKMADKVFGTHGKGDK